YNYKMLTASSSADSIYNGYNHVTISAGYGNDTINNTSYGDYSSLSGGWGSDSINAGSSSYYVTLNGGYGNDTLTGSNNTSYGDVFQFGNHDDFDVITNYGTNDTLHLTGLSNLSNSYYYNVGSDKVISLSSDGVVTLKGAASKNIKVKLSNGSMTSITPDNIIVIDVKYYATSYNYQKLTTTSSNEKINNDYKYVTIDAGRGNDTIDNTSYGDYSSLSGGSGNDSINAGSNSYNVTLNGGYGNDTLTGSNNTSYGDVFQFGNHDDFDVITNYGTNDTIHLKDASSFDYHSVGNDRVISLSSDGVVTVKGGASKNIRIKWANGSIGTLSPSGYYSYEERNSVEEHWFTEDNNFTSNELDSITQPTTDNYSVGEINSSDVLTQSLDTMTITKSKKK
ncbi:MAG: hypothetical protein IJ728_04130, partial [Selenomonadaceae bacterium]|nr:hypothetical protein [Selenomonadaceae bacterium]